jgi:hypothetical protein
MIALLTVRPAPALADATAFFGWSPTVATRSTTGFAVGVSLLILGFEFEYAHLNNDQATATPSLGTGMFNVVVMTPTKTQLYVTAGGGVYHESLNALGNTNVGVNVGGGIKIPVAGPLRVRVDYRVMTLSNSVVGKAVQRFYVGGNIAF